MNMKIFILALQYLSFLKGQDSLYFVYYLMVLSLHIVDA